MKLVRKKGRLSIKPKKLVKKYSTPNMIISALKKQSLKFGSRRYKKYPLDSTIFYLADRVLNERKTLTKNPLSKNNDVFYLKYFDSMVGKKTNRFLCGLRYPLFFTIPLDVEVYVNVQMLLRQLTGKFYEMDELVTLLFAWFFQFYRRDKNKRANEPFIKTNKERDAKKILLKKFQETFSSNYLKSHRLSKQKGE